MSAWPHTDTYYYIIPAVTYPCSPNQYNKALTTGHFPSSLKSAIVKPLLKKAWLDSEMYKTFRPVSNLPFISHEK